MVRGTLGGMGTGVPASAGVEVFVSYTAPDEAWATWVAAVLESAGLTVAMQAWDSPAGANFVAWIDRQLATAGMTVALCSRAYFASHWCTQEWTGALAGRKIVPLRVEDCAIPAVLATIGYRDLHGVDETTARRRLLETVGLVRVARVSWGFPGRPTAGAAFPGRLPGIFTAPARLRHFTGRQLLLDQLRAGLTADGGPAAVIALHGLGGVGKTQLAIEYAHRHAAEYQAVIWVNADEPTLIPGQLAALTACLGLPATGHVTDDAVAVIDALRRRDGWLLVYDNADDSAALRPWLPGGGHTLVTSRHPGWGGLAHPIKTDVMARREAVALLARRVPGIEHGVADRIAAELGDLPLALEQAAAYLETTGTPPAGYLRRFQTRRSQMLGKGKDLAHGGTIDTLWTVTLDRLRQEEPAAVTLLELCAQMAPEPIPLTLFTEHPEQLPVALRGNSTGWDELAGALHRYGLACRDRGTLRLHRLPAAVIRAGLPSASHEASTSTVRRLLTAATSADPAHPASWPAWVPLVVHLTAAPALHPEGPGQSIDTATRALLLRTGRYLNARGDYRAAVAVNRDLHTRCRHALGEDHPDTLRTASDLALVLRGLGELQAARALSEDTLARMRRVLGEDHPDTLRAASNLARNLHEFGELQAARALSEDTLARMRRVLGEDHPDTLRAASNLAIDLCELGELRAARVVDEDVLARRRRILGDDHPRTLASASYLAFDLRGLGELQAARALSEDTLARMRRVLGEDHQHTLDTAHNLAMDLADLGETGQAQDLIKKILLQQRATLGEDHPDTRRSELTMKVLTTPSAAPGGPGTASPPSRS